MTAIDEVAVRNHVTEDPPRPPRQQVVTTFAPKGGCGVTTFAINLAAALHAADQRVCLVDLDLEFGDVSVSLGLDPVRSIADALDPAHRDEEVGDLLTEYQSGFDCLLAPIEPSTADEIPESVVTGVLEALRARYDFVVVDAQHRFSDPVLAALDSTDHLVLVANPEITSLKSIRICLDVLDVLEQPRSARQLVLQKDGIPSGLTAEEVSTALGLDIAATVPFHESLTASINDGVPLLRSDPGHAVSAAVRHYAVRAFLPEVAESASARNRRRRLFGRKS